MSNWLSKGQPATQSDGGQKRKSNADEETTGKKPKKT